MAPLATPKRGENHTISDLHMHSPKMCPKQRITQNNHDIDNQTYQTYHKIDLSVRVVHLLCIRSAQRSQT